MNRTQKWTGSQPVRAFAAGAFSAPYNWPQSAAWRLPFAPAEVSKPPSKATPRRAHYSDLSRRSLRPMSLWKDQTPLQECLSFSFLPRLCGIHLLGQAVPVGAREDVLCWAYSFSPGESQGVVLFAHQPPCPVLHEWTTAQFLPPFLSGHKCGGRSSGVLSFPREMLETSSHKIAVKGGGHWRSCH